MDENKEKGFFGKLWEKTPVGKVLAYTGLLVLGMVIGGLVYGNKN